MTRHADTSQRPWKLLIAVIGLLFMLVLSLLGEKANGGWDDVPPPKRPPVTRIEVQR